jgi:hypothetical protein
VGRLLEEDMLAARACGRSTKRSAVNFGYDARFWIGRLSAEALRAGCDRLRPWRFLGVL